TSTRPPAKKARPTARMEQASDRHPNQMLTSFGCERGPHMIPAKFDYLAPTSVEEAISALAASDDAKVIAGGQSLLPVLRMRLNAPELIVDIGEIDSLKDIVDEGDSVLIGAMVPYYRILADPSVQTGLAPLHQ